MFKFLRNNANSNMPAIKMMPTTASTAYAVGDALALASGALVKATGTTKPEFICAAKYTAPATGMEDIAVYPVYETQEWETELAVAPESSAALAVGDKVTIHTDGAQVTATKTGGVAKIVSISGQTVGSAVVVKF